MTGELKVDPERRLGEILRDAPKNEGGKPPEKTGATLESVSAPTLASLAAAFGATLTTED